MAILTTEQMQEVAHDLALGVSTRSLLDKHEDAIRANPEEYPEECALSSRELRKILSNEMSRANPQSPRYHAERYNEIHEKAAPIRKQMDAALHKELRQKLIEKLTVDSEKLDTAADALIEAAKGENGKLKPAGTPTESQNAMAMARDLQHTALQYLIYAVGFSEVIASGRTNNLHEVLPELAKPKST